MNGMTTAPGMDAAHIVGDILNGPGDLARKSSIIASTLTPLLTKAMKSSRVRQGSVLDVVIFGYERDNLKLIVLNFSFASDGRITRDTHVCPSSDCQVEIDRADACKDQK
jgi:hypothetical protein